MLFDFSFSSLRHLFLRQGRVRVFLFVLARQFGDHWKNRRRFGYPPLICGRAMQRSAFVFGATTKLLFAWWRWLKFVRVIKLYRVINDAPVSASKNGIIAVTGIRPTLSWCSRRHFVFGRTENTRMHRHRFKRNLLSTTLNAGLVLFKISFHHSEGR